MGSVDRGIAEFEETNFKQVARPSAMASSDKIWHYEQVKIKDSEYAKKCGIGGDCYFYVSKGQIKISPGQQDVVGLGHLEDPHVGGQQHHLLPGVGQSVSSWRGET